MGGIGNRKQRRSSSLLILLSTKFLVAAMLLVPQQGQAQSSSTPTPTPTPRPVQIPPPLGNDYSWSVYEGNLCIANAPQGYAGGLYGISTWCPGACQAMLGAVIANPFLEVYGYNTCTVTALSSTAESPVHYGFAFSYGCPGNISCSEYSGVATPTPTPTPSPSPTPPPVDLSISGVTLNQPAGTSVPIDKDGNPVISTTTPQTAVPAPKSTPVPAQAKVTINLSGTPNGATATSIKLKLGGKTLATHTVNIGQLSQGPNIIDITFTPPTEPELLDVLPLIATVNDDHAVLEASYANNSFTRNVNTMVLCKVEDGGRSVPFAAQVSPPWGSYRYGISSLSTNPQSTMAKYGCSVTDLYMLFSSYGIRKAPLGSPALPYLGVPLLPGLNGEALDPGTLNQAMANYTTYAMPQISGSVGFDAHNNPIWSGAAEIARAGYRAQCANTVLCDPNNAPNVVSYKGNRSFASSTDEQVIKALQNEICSANPVIVKVSKTGGGQHFLLATGIVLDQKTGTRTWRVNNPGSTQAGRSENALYTELKADYPSIQRSILFHPSSDPSMMFITAPMNVHFVVTDPLGRRAGFDPTTNTTYAEIPGADYDTQSIDTPADPGFAAETLVSERYFSSASDVPDGSYQVQVFALTSGSYYVDYRSTDSTGVTNDAVYRTGTLSAGQKVTQVLRHSAETVPVPNASLRLSEYELSREHDKSFAKTNVRLAGHISSFNGGKISLKSNFRLTIGGVNGYTFTVPSSHFKIDKDKKRTEYFYGTKGVDIRISDSGQVAVRLTRIDLSMVDSSQLDYVRISIDSVLAETRAKIKCGREGCSMERNKQDCDHRGDK